MGDESRVMTGVKADSGESPKSALSTCNEFVPHGQRPNLEAGRCGRLGQKASPAFRT